MLNADSDTLKGIEKYSLHLKVLFFMNLKLYTFLTFQSVISASSGEEVSTITRDATSPWDIVTTTGNSFKIAYDPSTSLVTMKVEVKANTWFGVGFKDQMKNSDMITFQGTGDKGEVIDQWSTAKTIPQVDSQQDITWSSTRDSNNNYVFEATRKLDTGDSGQDTIIELDT
jgi:hypothetical protein